MKVFVLLMALFYHFSYANEKFFENMRSKNYNDCVYFLKLHKKHERVLPKDLTNYDEIIKKFKILGISYMFGIDISLHTSLFPPAHDLCFAMSEDNLHNAIEELKEFIFLAYKDKMGTINPYNIEKKIDIYNNSKEYQDEIEQIVKKYCDKCNIK